MFSMRMEIRDPNDATHVNQVFVEEGDTLRTKLGPIVLGDMLGQGAGGKVFVARVNLLLSQGNLAPTDSQSGNPDDRPGNQDRPPGIVVKVIRRYRLEARIAAVLHVEPCPNAIPILEVRQAGDYAAILMPLGRKVYAEDLQAIDLDALYAPVEAYLAQRRLRYTDSRVPRNLIRLDGQIRVIDFSHVRWIRAPRRRLRESQPPLSF